MEGVVVEPMLATAFALVVLFGGVLVLALGFDRALPKHRMNRAARAGNPIGKPIADLPSIARRQYGFMKPGKSGSGQYSPLRFIIWADHLVQASGLPISLLQFGLIVLAAMTAVIFAVEQIGAFGFFRTALIVAPSTAFLAVQLLLRRRAALLRRFQAIFPEALDLIVRSVRAGLPVSESIKMISTEVAEPVGSSFREVGANLTIGLSLEESLALLQQKMPLPEVKFFAISLTIQQETGGNLAEILSNLSAIMRKRLQIGKKIRALSSEARASALIIGSLPFIVGFAIYFLNRSYIEVLWLDESGRIFLFAAIASIGLGAAVMAKLIRFEI